MTKTTRRERKTRRKIGAVGAAAVAFALGGAACWAQFPNLLTDSVRPYLETQRQATFATAAAPTANAASNADDAPERLELEAAIVAVERYSPESGLAPLRGCCNDARALKGWLDANFDEEFRQTDAYRRKIATLSDEADGASAAPTRENILRLLRQKASVPCARLFVSFAGHGVSIGGKSFLCPVDVAAFDEENVAEAVASGDRSAALEAGNAANMIAVSDVLTILKNAKANEVILLLDACRGGSVENSFMREFADLLKNAEESFKKTDGGAFYVLTSCSLGEEALEVTKNREARGAFGYHFVEGLGGAADYAGCCDGAVTLVEAYNYAYSKVVDEARREGSGATQTPELFMANVGLRQLPTLARVALADLATTDVDAWQDQAYLLYVGRVLADTKWSRGVNEVGLQTLNCVLDGAPNNSLALALRGSVRRKLGDYVGSLDDWEKIGQKFQLYVKSRRDDDPAKPPRNDAEKLTLRLLDDAGGRASGASVSSTDLLTVAQIKTDAQGARWGYVVEANNVALEENAGWIALESTVWDWRLAARAITATTLQPTSRVVDYNASSGVAPGRNYIQGGGGGSTPGPLYH